MRTFLELLGLALVGTLVGACITVVPPTRIKPGQLIGIIEEPRSEALRVMTSFKERREVETDAQTRYAKWVTHQPWALDQIVNAKDVVVGRCVKVTLRERSSRIARTIEVSLDRPGAVSDPCKAFR